MTINEIQDQIIEEFEAYDDFMDRYAYIIELGALLPSMPDVLKSPDNKIDGCQSRVWIDGSLAADGTMVLQADSDSSIVKGLIALLVRVLGGQRPDDVASAELYFIDRIGLHDHLSPTRSNGLLAMVKRIKALAIAYQALQQQAE